MSEEAPEIAPWISRHIRTVPPNMPVSACLALMRELDVRHLPVLDPHDRIIGMVTEFELLEEVRAGDRLGWALEALDPLKLLVNADLPVADAIRKMLASKRTALMVIGAGGGLKGLFTEKDALLAAAQLIEDWPPVSEVMTGGDLVQVDPDTDCAAALEAIDALKIRHLLVVEPDGRMHGVVSHRDLVGRTGPVEDVVPDAIVTTREVAPLSDVVDAMIEHGIGSVPVIADRRRAVGMVTRTNILRYLANTLDPKGA